MKRFMAAAALLVCLSSLTRAHPSLLLKAVVLPCEANAQNLELMEASLEATPCVEMSTQDVSFTPEPASALAPTEKPVGARRGKITFALPPENANLVRLTRIEKPPVFDVKADEEAWKSAALFKGFYQWRPSDSAAASVRTEMRAGYDSKLIYFAFCGYDDPSKIRASVAKRASSFDDDSIGLILDTFNDKHRADELFFNPLGIQQDGFLTEGVNDDFNVDIVMESTGSFQLVRANQKFPIFFEEKRPFSRLVPQTVNMHVDNAGVASCGGSITPRSFVVGIWFSLNRIIVVSRFFRQSEFLRM